MAQCATTSHRPELVFGLVGGAGTRLKDLSGALKTRLSMYGYKSIDIRLSQLLNNFQWKNQEEVSEFDRIRYLQDKGDEFRKQLHDGAALARAGITEIRNQRRTKSDNPDSPASAHAYILHQLKHPDEVDFLRQVYGSSFLLVAGHAPRASRANELARKMARADNKPGQESRFMAPAYQVIDIDEKQDSDYAQNTRDTYPKADFFANLGISGGEFAIHRFVDLLFGHPFQTPNPDEYAMYLASAASLRSSDDNRQVGAVIVRRVLDDQAKSVDVIATGMNEVPRGGGGYYWEGDSPDARDQFLLYRGEDRAREIKLSALTELIDKIIRKGWLKEGVHSSLKDLASELLPDLRRTQFMDIGEFSRPVHAEMAALIDSARRGVAVDGQTIYVTTFPCHNCAKHIIAAGIQRVVYLEPYPKSRANNLHREEIVLESSDGKPERGRVVFCAFSGIAPRQYRQLFSMSERGAKQERSLKQWYDDPQSFSPLYVHRNSAILYLAEEHQELEKLPTDIYHWDKATVCPNQET